MSEPKPAQVKGGDATCPMDDTTLIHKRASNAAPTVQPVGAAQPKPERKEWTPGYVGLLMGEFNEVKVIADAHNAALAEEREWWEKANLETQEVMNRELAAEREGWETTDSLLGQVSKERDKLRSQLAVLEEQGSKYHADDLHEIAQLREQLAALVDALKFYANRDAYPLTEGAYHKASAALAAVKSSDDQRKEEGK